MDSIQVSDRPEISLYHGDCVELMRTYPDKHFDLAIVDPPYGINWQAKVGLRAKENITENWDDSIPTEEYWNELFRVSKNQIIWGGNYFPLPPTQCFVFWYKQNPVPNFSDGELAWTSFKRPALCLDYRYYGGLQGNTSADKKIHPTQKPIQLYKWLLEKFAEEGNLILDTHLGSGNSAIASYEDKYSFVGVEINLIYYANAVKNFQIHASQLKLF